MCSQAFYLYKRSVNKKMKLLHKTGDKFIPFPYRGHAMYIKTIRQIPFVYLIAPELEIESYQLHNMTSSWQNL